MAFYQFNLLINFKYEDFKTNNCLKKKLKSFQLRNGNHFLELFSPNHQDLIEIKHHLKNKLNISNFHEEFQCIKQIGRGNFASVNKIKKIIKKNH